MSVPYPDQVQYQYYGHHKIHFLLKAANEVKVFQILFIKTTKKSFYSSKHEIPSQN